MRNSIEWKILKDQYDLLIVIKKRGVFINLYQRGVLVYGEFNLESSNNSPKGRFRLAIKRIVRHTVYVYTLSFAPL